MLSRARGGLETLLRSETFFFLALLLSADFIFIFLHGTRVAFDIPASELYSIAKDRGFAETFQYVKELWIVLLLGWLVFRRRTFLIVWALLYFYLLLDDSLRFHETLSRRFIAAFNIEGAAGLRDKDIGELIASGLVGLVFIVALVFVYRTLRSEEKTVFHRLALLFGLLVAVGVGVDTLHSFIMSFDPPSPKLVDLIMTVIEDGGEMVVISLTCWYLSLLLRSAEAKPTPPLKT